MSRCTSTTGLGSGANAVDESFAIKMTFGIACSVIAFWFAVRLSMLVFLRLESDITRAQGERVALWRVLLARTTVVIFAVLAVCAVYPGGFLAGSAMTYLLGDPPYEHAAVGALAQVVFAVALFVPSVCMVFLGAGAARLLLGNRHAGRRSMSIQ